VHTRPHSSQSLAEFHGGVVVCTEAAHVPPAFGAEAWVTNPDCDPLVHVATAQEPAAMVLHSFVVLHMLDVMVSTTGAEHVVFGAPHSHWHVSGEKAGLANASIECCP
jgi:hypothetical protein